MQRSSCIGIDIGTTNSQVYTYDTEIREPIPKIYKDSKYIPTCISYENKNGIIEKKFGSESVNSPITDIIRMIGVPFNSKFIQKLIPFWKEKGIDLQKLNGKYANDDLYVKFEVCIDKDNQNYANPVNILGEYLKWLIEDVSNIQIVPKSKVVITVPSIYNTNKRNAILEAAQLAGFKRNNIFILNSSSAVAISYFQQQSNVNKMFNNLAVIDFGGGNIDLSIFSISKYNFKVKTVEGDLYLGGNDIDQLIYQWFKNKCREEFYIYSNEFSVSDNLKLIQLCKRAKEQLTFQSETSITFDIHDKNISMNLTREEFNFICSPLINRVEELITKMLSSAYINSQDVDGILLVGGSSIIPIFQEKIHNIFGKEKILNFDEIRDSNGMGACYLAAMKKGFLSNQYQKMNYNQKLPHSIGIGIRNLQMPKEEKDLFSPILSKNQEIPLKNTGLYHNLYATSVLKYNIYECDDDHVVEDGFIDSMVNDKLSFKPPGQHITEMTMKMDENGLLEVKGYVRGECGVFNRYDMAMKKQVLGDFCKNSSINQSFPEEYQMKEEDCEKFIELINFAQCVALA